jgi:hypothetical protein
MSKAVEKRTRKVSLRIESLEKRENPAPIVPAYNSNPTAFAQLYMDFDGNVGPSGWCGTSGSITTQVFGTDGDFNNFSASELTIIEQTWKRVAEDFAPFNINVTTVVPSDFNDKHAVRLAIGGQSGGINWSGVGGVGCLASFYSGGSSNNIAFVHAPNVSNNAKNMGLVTSHEAGHTFNLQHQDNPTGGCGGYHSGGNYNGESKGPIMGAPYGATREIWWQGFEGCGTQNDMNILSNSNNAYGYRADDHTNNFADARRFRTSGGNIIGSPGGIIHQTSDIDVWAFTSPAGTVNITVGAAALGPNLDVVAELWWDNAGTPQLLTTVDTAGNNFSAVVNFAVPVGKKYLVVKSDGDYGEVGQYTISGTVPPPPAPGPGTDGPSAEDLALAAQIANSTEYVDPDFDPNFKFRCGCPSCMAAAAGLQTGDQQVALATIAHENARSIAATSSSATPVLVQNGSIANPMDVATVEPKQTSVSSSIANSPIHRVGPSVLQLDAAVLGDPLGNG